MTSGQMLKTRRLNRLKNVMCYGVSPNCDTERSFILFVRLSIYFILAFEYRMVSSYIFTMPVLCTAPFLGFHIVHPIIINNAVCSSAFHQDIDDSGCSDIAFITKTNAIVDNIVNITAKVGQIEYARVNSIISFMLVFLTTLIPSSSTLLRYKI